jgi:hypothetical protein
MKRRILLKLGLFVLLKLGLLVLAGAIINVAVAWGCAIATGSEFDVASRFVAPPRDQHRPWSALSSNEKALLLNAGWTAPTNTRGGTIWAGTSQRTLFGLREITYHPYAEMKGLMRQRADGRKNSDVYLPIVSPEQATAVRVIVGWPCASLHEEQFHYPAGRGQGQPQARTVHTGSLEMPAFAGLLPKARGYFVPSRPIWPGFAVNTIFYAAILWVLFAAPRRVGRRRRRRRGLCPNCAYPIGDSRVCTECGAPLPGRSGRGDCPSGSVTVSGS